MTHSPAEFRQILAVYATGATNAAGTLLNGLGYPDEHVRLTARDVKKAINELRKTADDLAALLPLLDDTKEGD